MTPEQEQTAYEEFLAQFERDGVALQPVAPDVEDERLRTYWDGNTNKLSEGEARKVLMARMGMRNAGGAQTWLPDYVLKSIPSKAWTPEFLENLDLRPYMKNVVDYYDMGGRFYEGSGSTIDMSNDKLVERAQRVLDEQSTIANEAVQTAMQDDDAVAPPFEATTAGLAVPAQVVGWTSDTQIAAQEGRTGTKFSEWAAGADSLDRPMVPEQAVRDAFALSNSNDVIDVLGIADNYAQKGQNVDIPDVQMADERAPTSPMDPGGGRYPNKLSIEAAAKYLQSPNVTPSMVKTLQDTLVRAGYLDGINARIIPGDGWDEATNMAWRRALADSVKQNVPLPDLLKQQTEQRTAGFRPLSGLAQQSMLDQVARSVLGRSLDQQEQAQLIQQLYTLRDKPMSGPNADGSGGNMGEGAWFSEADVTEKLLSEHGGEMGGMAASDAMYRNTKMIEAMFK
jgi:hypothetical protein